MGPPQPSRMAAIVDWRPQGRLTVPLTFRWQLDIKSAMVRVLVHKVLGGLLILSFTGFAFQEPEGPGAVLIQKPVRRQMQAQADTPPPGAIQINSTLVQVPVHVTNALGVNIAGLTREDFELWEDGVRQPITYFSMADAPASIGLVYDCSGSMHGKMAEEAAAAEAFMHTANPEDEFFLVKFGDRPQLATRFTAQPLEILTRISRARPFGRTPLLDALFMAMAQMKNARNTRKALVVLSDGGDNQSRRNVHQIKSGLAEADLQLYAMGIYSPGSAPGGVHKLSSEEKNGPLLLNDLAEMTGGRMYPADQADRLPEISARISRDLRNEYMLGYAPALRHDGKYHRITVNVRKKDLRLHFRQGYYDRQ
jgi:Ca-activated chloride channel family protein